MRMRYIIWRPGMGWRPLPDTLSFMRNMAVFGFIDLYQYEAMADVLLADKRRVMDSAYLYDLEREGYLNPEDVKGILDYMETCRQEGV